MYIRNVFNEPFYGLKFDPLEMEHDLKEQISTKQTVLNVFIFLF